MKPLSSLNGAVTVLPRGGYLINSSCGYVQFGAPPETIKDTMKLPEGVPGTFVLPRELFHWDKGISIAELEFPLYYNFFLRHKKTRIVLRKDQASPLLTVLSQALFGPETIDIKENYTDNASPEIMPDLKKEREYIAGNYTMDDLIEFIYFDKDKASFDDIRIFINKKENFEIYDKKAFIKEIPGIINYTPVFKIGERSVEPFEPPRFGITCLGPSHGFDPYENTSGYILWLNHRGIMIDPPVDSTLWLLKSNVNPKLIDSIILTHCHADHDAGTFQKIIEEGKITIYTTSTILESFLKKYTALTGESVAYMKKLFHFSPVYIDRPFYILGGRFKAFFTLHSIPTIGFTLEYHGKSFVYSSDHKNDPDTHRTMYDQHYISEARYDELRHFAWDSDFIYHESGFEPLHTSIGFLDSLDDAIKEKTTVYHIAKKDFPENSKLKLASFGLENTFYIDTPASEFDKVSELLHILKHLDFVESFTMDKVQEFLEFIEELSYEKGQCIIEQGTRGDYFYIIGRGNVAVVNEEQENFRRLFEDGNVRIEELDRRSKKIYGQFEYFGEVGVLTNKKRQASVYALTDVKLYAMKRERFLHFINNTSFEKNLKRLAAVRSFETWNILSKNNFFKILTSYQLTWLESVLKETEFEKNKILIRENRKIEKIYIVREGTVDVFRRREKIDALGPGGFAGVMDALYNRKKSPYTFKAATHLKLFYIDPDAAIAFLDHNPGLIRKLTYKKFR